MSILFVIRIIGFLYISITINKLTKQKSKKKEIKYINQIFSILSNDFFNKYLYSNQK